MSENIDKTPPTEPTQPIESRILNYLLQNIEEEITARGDVHTAIQNYKEFASIVALIRQVGGVTNGPAPGAFYVARP